MIVKTLLLASLVFTVAGMPATLNGTIDLLSGNDGNSVAVDCEGNIYYAEFTDELFITDRAGGDNPVVVNLRENAVGGDPVNILALSWDATRNLLWGAGCRQPQCSIGVDNQVFLINATSGVAIYQWAMADNQDELSAIVYDPRTSAVWIVQNRATVRKYDEAGILRGSYPFPGQTVRGMWIADDYIMVVNEITNLVTGYSPFQEDSVLIDGGSDFRFNMACDTLDDGNVVFYIRGTDEDGSSPDQLGVYNDNQGLGCITCPLQSVAPTPFSSSSPTASPSGQFKGLKKPKTLKKQQKRKSNGSKQHQQHQRHQQRQQHQQHQQRQQRQQHQQHQQHQRHQRR